MADPCLGVGHEPGIMARVKRRLGCKAQQGLSITAFIEADAVASS
jgi:hypothetical protein